MKQYRARIEAMIDEQAILGRKMDEREIRDFLSDRLFDDIQEMVLERRPFMFDFEVVDDWKKTGCFIRAQIDGKWDSVDIGDSRLTDKQVFDWLRSRGGKNEWAERCVMLLLGRNQNIVEGN